jgi:transposase
MQGCRREGNGRHAIGHRMKYDRTKPWQYSIEQLVADLPKWRRDLVLKQFNESERFKNYHASASTYWHRRCVDMLMIERDRSKHIDMLEQQVLGV